MVEVQVPLVAILFIIICISHANYPNAFLTLLFIMYIQLFTWMSYDECLLCKIKFETTLELEVHHVSLSHHIKLEAGGVNEHCCSQCDFRCQSLTDYSKHVDTEEHRKRRERLRAQIDTLEAADEPQTSQMRPPPSSNHQRSREDMGSHEETNYVEPRFHRNGPGRLTYPARGAPLPSRPPPNQGPPQQHHGGYMDNGRRDLPPAMPHPNRDYYGYRPDNDYELPWNGRGGQQQAYHQEMSRFNRNVNERKSFQGRPDYYQNADEWRPRHWDPSRCMEEERQSGRSRSRSRPSSPVPTATEPKRGLIERLSMRRKEKPGTVVKTPKQKLIEKKSPEAKTKRTPTPTEKGRSKTASPVVPGKKTPSVSAGSRMKKKGLLVTSSPSLIMDKKKTWERLLRLKGVGKKQSQRIQQDRLNKFRLMDKTGKVVEDSEEDRAAVAAVAAQSSQCVHSGSASESSCSSLVSTIWGTGPELYQPGARQLPTSQLTPTTPEGDSSSLLEDSTTYASLGPDVPISTPHHYGNALRAYNNDSADMNKVLLEIEEAKQTGSTGKTKTSMKMEPPSLNQHYGSYGSSLALDDVSMGSRMDITMAASSSDQSDAADTTAVVNKSSSTGRSKVKMEPVTVDSPPPESLPNPPSFDTTMCPETTRLNSTVASTPSDTSSSGEQKLKELWQLVHLEEQKKKELRELTERVLLLESDLAQIQHRKLQLMSASPPAL